MLTEPLRPTPKDVEMASSIALMLAGSINAFASASVGTPSVRTANSIGGGLAPDGCTGLPGLGACVVVSLCGLSHSVSSSGGALPAYVPRVVSKPVSAGSGVVEGADVTQPSSSSGREPLDFQSAHF